MSTPLPRIRHYENGKLVTKELKPVQKITMDWTKPKETHTMHFDSVNSISMEKIEKINLRVDVTDAVGNFIIKEAINECQVKVKAGSLDDYYEKQIMPYWLSKFHLENRQHKAAFIRKRNLKLTKPEIMGSNLATREQRGKVYEGVIVWGTDDNV